MTSEITQVYVNYDEGLSAIYVPPGSKLVAAGATPPSAFGDQMPTQWAGPGWNPSSPWTVADKYIVSTDSSIELPGACYFAFPGGGDIDSKLGMWMVKVGTVLVKPSEGDFTMEEVPLNSVYAAAP